MSFRDFLQWVRGSLVLYRKHRAAPPTSTANQNPSPAITTKPQRPVEDPSDRELELTQSPSETAMARPDDSQDPSQAASARLGAPMEASKTQFSGCATETTDLVIGLDFGTLSSRVIVRSPYVGEGRAVPVLWRVRSDMPPHFLPVALREDPKGALTLASAWTDREDCTLKTDLMDHPNDSTARARVAAYLGLTLREARSYVLDTQVEAYGSYRIRWAIHLGVPSAGYDDHKVKAAFLCVARAAWLLSLRSEPTTLDTAMKALQRAGNTGAIEADPDVTVIDVVPEIAALVVGYARSRRRREGLHVILDVGASTVDICGFGLQGRDGDDRYSLYTALVEQLGIRQLHHRRMDAIKRANAGRSVLVPASLNPFSVVPVAGRDCVAAPVDRLCAELASVDDAYAESCTRALMKVFLDLRKWRDPNSPAWTTGLPVFKAGGGGRHGLITRAIQEADYRLTTMTRASRIDVQPLPKLENLAVARSRPGDSSPEGRGEERSGGPQGASSTETGWGDAEGMAEQLGVAYGLSFDRFEIGDIDPPHKIDNVPPMPLSEPIEYISKDHV